MSSNCITIENSSPVNDSSLSPTSNLNKLYSTASSRSSSTDSSSSSNKNRPEARTSSSSSSQRKESTIKLPYPILSDHRDPSSVLPLLQKETQTASKKILDVTQQITDCEKRLTSHVLSVNTKKSIRYECIQRKQQLDALKKHERRVNLQIDYITTKTEIKGLEEEQQQMVDKQNSDEYKQIDILLKKLKQKLDQMKIYMRKRNEEMKKLSHTKQQSSTANGSRKQISTDQKSQQGSSSSTSNRKRPLLLPNASHSNKHSKSTTYYHQNAPVVRLASRLSNHQGKSHPKQTPTVRFLNKTTDSSMRTINSTSPTTPASSSSTLSPPLIASTSNEDISKSLPRNIIDEDGELDVEFDMDELFSDDPYSEQSIKRFKSVSSDFKHNPNVSKAES